MHVIAPVDVHTRTAPLANDAGATREGPTSQNQRTLDPLPMISSPWSDSSCFMEQPQHARLADAVPSHQLG
jgi:hypothetical protein